MAIRPQNSKPHINKEYFTTTPKFHKGLESLDDIAVYFKDLTI